MEEKNWSRRRIRRVAPVVQDWARANRRQPTDAEAILWGALRGRQVGGAKFRRQHPIGIYVLDFWCPEHRLCIEIDGGYHNDSAQKARDDDRDRTLRRNAVWVLRVTNEEVRNNLPAVLQKIAERLR